MTVKFWLLMLHFSNFNHDKKKLKSRKEKKGKFGKYSNGAGKKKKNKNEMVSSNKSGPQSVLMPKRYTEAFEY